MIRFTCPHCQREYQLPAALAGLPLVCKGCAQRFVPAAQPAAPPPAAPPPPAPKFDRLIVPPAPKPEAPTPAAGAPKAAPAAKAAPPKPVPKPEPKPVPPPPSADDTASTTGGDVLVSKADSTPDIDFNVGGPTAASLSDANRQRPKGLSSADMAAPQPASDTDRDAASVPELDLDALARARTEADLNLPPKPAPQSPAPRARTEPELELPKPKPKRERPAPAPQPEPQAEPEPEPVARSGLIPFAADLLALVVLLAGGMLVGELIVKKHTGAVLSNFAENPIEGLLWATVPLLLALVYLLLAGRGLSLGARLRGR